ncbi:MAG: HIT family protein [Candidatus Liptonbacteria bacterium]|nr:HIT family protein [Candidatus Liptonbacteria bacterium]
MIEDWSEENIKQNCPHCDLHSQAFEYSLKTTENFTVVCDANPIVEGHLLIIPKKHYSCIGEYPRPIFEEFSELDREVSIFLTKEYGECASFEHGIFGQTVFHSHVHYLPLQSTALDIIPEGEKEIQKLEALTDLKEMYEKEGGYLYFAIGGNRWTVNKALATPRFFRDRFAKALHHPERGNWKEIRATPELHKLSKLLNENTITKWNLTLLPNN